MQKDKIEKMTKNEIIEWLKAINILLRRYEKRINLYGKCPFCKLGGSCCQDCIWKIIEGERCGIYAERRGLGNGATRTEAWIKLRIPMLKNWKKILKNELGRREK